MSRQSRRPTGACTVWRDSGAVCAFPRTVAVYTASPRGFVAAQSCNSLSHHQIVVTLHATFRGPGFALVRVLSRTTDGRNHVQDDHYSGRPRVADERFAVVRTAAGGTSEAGAASETTKSGNRHKSQF